MLCSVRYNSLLLFNTFSLQILEKLERLYRKQQNTAKKIPRKSHTYSVKLLVADQMEKAVKSLQKKKEIVKIGKMIFGKAF